jgi:hypothetical protein
MTWIATLASSTLPHLTLDRPSITLRIRSAALFTDSPMGLLPLNRDLQSRKFPLKRGMQKIRRQGEPVLMDEPQEEERLPAGYSMGMEDSNLLVLRRADGSVVKRFVFSSTSPTPQALRQAAEEDLLANRRTAELSPYLCEGKSAEEGGS